MGPEACEAAADGSLFDSVAHAEADYAKFKFLCDEDFSDYNSRRELLAPQIKPAGNFVQRLKANEPGAAFSRKLNCLKPARKLADLQRRHSFDSDLLSLKLKRGRVCKAALCSLGRCGLHVRDSVLTPEESAILVAHGQGVLDAEGPSAYDAGWPYRRVDFMRSAHNGSTEGHVLKLRVAERMRRLASEIFELPLAHVGIAETLLAWRGAETNDASGGGTGHSSSSSRSSSPPPRSPPPPRPAPRSPPPLDEEAARAKSATLADRGSEQFSAEARAAAESDEPESQYHCDESLAPHFHFTSIVWLSSHGTDFTGGELAFLYNQSWAWMLVEPAAGRAAFFSSGWENIHGIKPLGRGQRWALSVPFMVSDELVHNDQARQEEDARAMRNGERVLRGAAFREACVHPVDNFDSQRCRETWAANLTQGTVAGSVG